MLCGGCHRLCHGVGAFAKGQAAVWREETPSGTILRYDAKAQVGGKLAQLGSRIIDGFAKSMADKFFDNFKKVVEGPGGDEPGPEEMLEAVPQE